MDLVRETAGATGAYLVDHHWRWERLRGDNVEQYRQLVLDSLHVNPGDLNPADVMPEPEPRYLRSTFQKSCS